MERLSFVETWHFLRENTPIILLDDAPPPEKDGIGIAYYRWGEINDPPEGEEYGVLRLENLTMPIVNFYRCGIENMSFRNTVLSGSWFCYNDFINVDFTDADLRQCDMRCSIFQNVQFVRADLREADLRMSSFENCDFTNANMVGTKMRHSQAKGLSLSEEQKQHIDWKRRDGKEP